MRNKYLWRVTWGMREYGMVLRHDRHFQTRKAALRFAEGVTKGRDREDKGFGQYRRGFPPAVEGTVSVTRSLPVQWPELDMSAWPTKENEADERAFEAAAVARYRDQMGLDRPATERLAALRARQHLAPRVKLPDPHHDPKETAR